MSSSSDFVLRGPPLKKLKFKKWVSLITMRKFYPSTTCFGFMILRTCTQCLLLIFLNVKPICSNHMQKQIWAMRSILTTINLFKIGNISNLTNLHICICIYVYILQLYIRAESKDFALTGHYKCCIGYIGEQNRGRNCFF